MVTIDRNLYGVQETNGLADGYHDSVKYDEELTLSEVAERGGKISRLRLLTEYVPALHQRIVDVSYIHATMPDGSIHPVRNSADIQYYSHLKVDLLNWARAEGVFAKGIGLLDEDNWSVM